MLFLHKETVYSNTIYILYQFAFEVPLLAAAGIAIPPEYDYVKKKSFTAQPPTPEFGTIGVL